MCIQATSPALLFILALVISRAQGPTAQGEFATGKALVDLLVVAGGLGFGQSIVNAVQTRGANRRQLFFSLAFYSAALIALFSIILIYILPQQVANTSLETVLLSLCAAAIVFNNLSRAILLTIHDGVVFAWYTALPGIIFFIVFSLAVALGITVEHFFPELAAIVALFVVSGAIIFSFPFVALGLALGTSTSPPWSSLFKNGFDAFLQQIFSVSQVYLSIYILQSNAEDARQVGWFSIGIIIYQAIGMPLQMVGPLFVNRWIIHREPARKANELARVMRICAWGGGLSLIAAPLLYLLIPLLFGEAFFGASSVAFIVGLTAYPILVGRACVTVVVAEGKFILSAKQAALRAFIVVFLALGISCFTSINASTMALIWLVSEVASTIYILQRVCGLMQTSWTTFLLSRTHQQQE
jgi:O-antigen/teichoic acid export membrane protein